MRGFDRPRDPARIRTLRVKTDPAGLIDLRVESGDYRFMLFGSGKALVTVMALSGASVECTQGVVLELSVLPERHISLALHGNSTATVTPSENARGTVTLHETATVQIVSNTVAHSIHIHRATEQNDHSPQTTNDQ